MKPNFRAWDNESEKMLEVANISFDKEAYGYDLITVDKTNDNHIFWTFTRLEDFILMQATGLKDVNGVEIFEGDILRLTLNDYAELKKPDIFTVSSDEEYYGDVLYLQNINYHINQDDTRDSIEIIGNIYENPELLEVAE